jgi:hypothetical protein
MEINAKTTNAKIVSESNYSFLMFKVTDKGYESEGGESKEANGPEQSQGQSVIEVTSSADENEPSTIANDLNPDENESSSITA